MIGVTKHFDLREAYLEKNDSISPSVCDRDLSPGQIYEADAAIAVWMEVCAGSR